MDKSYSKSYRKSVLLRAAGVYGGLFAFGTVYNWIVDRLEENGWDEGYTSDLVIGGVLVTVAGTVPVIGWQRAAAVLGAFVASGLPMTVGSKYRYRRMRMSEGHYGQGRKSGAATWLYPGPHEGRGANGYSGSLSALIGNITGRR